jgi:dATP pyrophosphohydrolase
VFVVDELSFAVELWPGDAIVISEEHAEFTWLSLAEASARLRWDSNRTALWELNERLRRGL